MALSYFINRKKTTCVITFKGSLTPNDAESLDACLKEALLETSRYYILNMGGLKEVEPSVSRRSPYFSKSSAPVPRYTYAICSPIPAGC